MSWYSSTCLFALLFLLNHIAIAEEFMSRHAYKIQPGDILTVSVWKEPDLQREILVRPDGGFSFPLAGNLSAYDKTVAELETELKNKLDQYIDGPTINIAVTQTQGNKVYVIGQVNRPGEFVMVRRTDVLQALSMAGGTTTFADTNSIRIIRRSLQGEQTALKFNFNDIKKGKRLTQNILLQSGDVVIVP